MLIRREAVFNSVIRACFPGALKKVHGLSRAVGQRLSRHKVQCAVPSPVQNSGHPCSEIGVSTYNWMVCQNHRKEMHSDVFKKQEYMLKH